MTSKSEINRVVSWRTTKVESGYKYKVYSFDEGIDNLVHYTGIETSRAKAAGRAKKHVRYLKSLQVK